MLTLGFRRPALAEPTVSPSIMTVTVTADGTSPDTVRAEPARPPDDVLVSKQACSEPLVCGAGVAATVVVVVDGVVSAGITSNVPSEHEYAPLVAPPETSYPNE